MRQRGSRTTVGGLGRQDHGCLVHHDDAVLAEAAVTYLQDGLGLGQRLMYVGATPGILEGLGDADALRAAGILEVVDTDGLYGGFEPDRLEADCNAAITAALADGFTGLRTFAAMDVGAPAEDLIRWEARADDLRDLEFADHTAVLALGRVCGDTGLTCTGTRSIVRRVADLVGVPL